MPARTIDTPALPDSSWIQQSFALPDGAITSEDMLRRTLTTASFKFTDTTPGGNFAINPPPQFTRYADIKVGGQGLFQEDGTFRPSQSRGMGRFYSEGLDDNAVHVNMRFGVPQFNSLSSFYSNFYNAEASAMTRTGRGTSAFFKLGRAVGFIVTLPIQAMMFVGKIAKFFSGKPASRYYYLKPTMPLYWNAVTTIVNNIAVNMGVIPRVFNQKGDQQLVDGGTGAAGDYVNATTWPSGPQNAFSRLLPEIYTQNGQIDVYAMSTRAQRLANVYNETLLQGLQNASASGQTGVDQVRQVMQQVQVQALVDPGTTKSSSPQSATSTTTSGTGGADPTSSNGYSLDAYLQAYMGLPNAAAKGLTGSTSSAGDSESTGDDTDPNFPKSLFKKFQSFLGGELHDGAAFVTFRVDNPGTAGESFSSSTKESDVQNKINSRSAQSRDARFDFANGNLSNNVFVNAVEGATSMVTSLISGLANSVHLGGLAAAAGSAFVDIPKMWDTSSATLPSASYTISLRSPYGNKMSRLTNLYIPLAMLLAGALPLSTGRQSYTSPFLCELYCKGRAQIRLGIIDSLSITRGSGNIGWTQDGEPLGIDVSFSVIDMSSVMHMPIAATFNFTQGAVLVAGAAVGAAVGAADQLGGTATGSPPPPGTIQKDAAAGAEAATALLGQTYDDDNTFTDYMAILGSLTFTDQVYTYRKWKLNMTRQMAAFNSWRSLSHSASWLMSTVPGRIVNSIARGTDRGKTGT